MAISHWCQWEKLFGTRNWEMETIERTKRLRDGFKGVWLGPNLKSTETLIGTSEGVVKAYTRERLSPSVQWDINRILDMKGTPNDQTRLNRD